MPQEGNSHFPGTLSKRAGHPASFGMYCLLLSTMMEHLVVGYGAGTEALRILMGCATALPVDGERMSSPPPNSVISCNAPIVAQYPTSRLPMFDASCNVYTHAVNMAAQAHSFRDNQPRCWETIPFNSA